MSRRNPLLDAPPYAIEQALARLGRDLRTARLRRGLSIEEVAQRIGTGSRAVADAEKGKPSAAIATSFALLWAYGLLADADVLADPARDREGSALERARAPK